jgi:CheY-like chemotaxis protein
MKAIIEWLQEIERRAESLYHEAEQAFKEDEPELSSLIAQLAAEEADHLKCMEEASGIVCDLEVPESLIELDKETTERIEGYFHECEESLRAGELTTKKMMEMIVNTEFSEWNDIFLYAVKLIKGSASKECISSIIGMQRHKERVKEFIETRDDSRECLEIIKNIPDIWNESILIVDDEEVILEVLENVLVEGKLIDRAANGEEALALLNDKYYSAIITDINMPVMDGIEFYKEAVEKFPSVKDRFIFFTASTDPEIFNFMRENGLKFLEKPSPIREIKRAVREVIDKASK